MGAVIGCIALIAAVIWLCWPARRAQKNANDSIDENERLINDASEKINQLLAREKANTALGLVDGRHFSTYVEEVKQLKREGRYEEAAGLLLRLIEAVENVCEASGAYPPPWFHEQLAIAYRKLKRKDLAERITERYARLPGASPRK